MEELIRLRSIKNVTTGVTTHRSVSPSLSCQSEAGRVRGGDVMEPPHPLVAARVFTTLRETETREDSTDELQVSLFYFIGLLTSHHVN